MVRFPYRFWSLFWHFILAKRTFLGTFKLSTNFLHICLHLFCFSFWSFLEPCFALFCTLGKGSRNKKNTLGWVGVCRKYYLLFLSFFFFRFFGSFGIILLVFHSSFWIIWMVSRRFVRPKHFYIFNIVLIILFWLFWGFSSSSQNECW